MPTLRSTFGAASLGLALLTGASCGAGNDLLVALTTANAREVAELLKDEPTPDFLMTDAGEPMSPLAFAASRGMVEVIDAILDVGADVEFADARGRTALTIACEQRVVASVRALLARGADPRHATRNGTTCLHLAHRGNGAMGTDVAIMQLLAARGVDLKSARTPVGWGPDLGDMPAAHYVALRMGTDAARLYVDSGVPVDVRDAEGRTLLAAAIAGNDEDLVRFLLERGADPRARDRRGRDVLGAAESLLASERAVELGFTPRVDPDVRAVIEVALAADLTTPRQRVAAMDRARREARATSDREAAARRKAETEAQDREILRRAALQRDFEANQPAAKPAANAGADLPEVCSRPDIAACRATGRTCDDCFHDTLSRSSGTKPTTCPGLLHEVCGSACCGNGYVCCIGEDGTGAHCRESRVGCKGWGVLRKRDYDRGMRRAP